MAKRFLVATGILIIIVAVIFFTYSFFMRYEPGPNKGDVEEVMGVTDLKEFGDIKGTYL